MLNAGKDAEKVGPHKLLVEWQTSIAWKMAYLLLTKVLQLSHNQETHILGRLL